MGGGIRGPGNGLGSPWPECVQRLALLDRRGVSRGDFAGVASRQGDGWLPVPRLGEGQFQRWFFSISWFGIAAGRDWRRSHRAGQGRFHHGAVRGVCAADGVGVGPPDYHSNVGRRGASDGGAVAVEFQSGQWAMGDWARRFAGVHWGDLLGGACIGDRSVHQPCVVVAFGAWPSGGLCGGKLGGGGVCRADGVGQVSVGVPAGAVSRRDVDRRRFHDANYRPAQSAPDSRVDHLRDGGGGRRVRRLADPE